MRTVKPFPIQFQSDMAKAKNGDVLVHARITMDQKRLGISLIRKGPLGAFGQQEQKSARKLGIGKAIEPIPRAKRFR